MGCRSHTGGTSVTRRSCTGLICTWQEHKDSIVEAPPTLSPTESVNPVTERVNPGNIISYLISKVICSIVGVSHVTQGDMYEQDMKSIPDASSVRLTGPLGTESPNAKKPNAPVGRAGWWIITLLLLLLGVGGVIRSCKNRSVCNVPNNKS